jgi:hypothetical protein
MDTDKFAQGCGIEAQETYGYVEELGKDRKPRSLR